MQGWGYAVFGKVVAGQDVVDKIAKVRTGRVGWYDDVPTEDVVIEKLRLSKCHSTALFLLKLSLQNSSFAKSRLYRRFAFSCRQTGN